MLEEPVSSDGTQQFIPPQTPITLLHKLGANFRTRERERVVMCWSFRTTAERSTLRSWSENGRDTCTTSWILSRSAVGTCHTAFALSSNTTRSLSTNLRKRENYGKYEFKKMTSNETRSLTRVLWPGGAGHRQHPGREVQSRRFSAKRSVAQLQCIGDEASRKLWSDHLEKSSLLSNTDLIEIFWAVSPIRP